MKNQKPTNIFSTISFKVLSYIIDENYHNLIDEQIPIILKEMMHYLNNYKINSNINDSVDITSALNLLRDSLNKFIFKYNRSSKNDLYLWLDDEMVMSEENLQYDNLISDNLAFESFSSNNLLEVIENMREEILQNDHIEISDKTFYIVFSICLFIRNSPTVVLKL